MKSEVIRYTLITDGSSDQILIHILNWLLREKLQAWAIQPQWVDFRSFQQPPRTLSERIERAIELFPCEIVFIHRDAENQTLEHRISEIQSALERLELADTVPICVVPIRMQEAWLLIDEMAIRTAAGNPNGAITLTLPSIAQLEHIPNPKQLLHDSLITASGLNGRRRQSFNPGQHALRIAEYMDDFSSLRNLSAFQRLEDDLEIVIQDKGWLS